MSTSPFQHRQERDIGHPNTWPLEPKEILDPVRSQISSIKKATVKFCELLSLAFLGEKIARIFDGEVALPGACGCQLTRCAEPLAF